MESRGETLGDLLREWRGRRRVSQLQLAADAGVSPRHLSFIETGRSQPSREMVVRLAEQLDVPLRDRNALLLAAGYAPAYRETDLDAPAMRAVRDALDTILAGHEPYPAVVVDLRWTLLSANNAAAVLIEGVPPALLTPPANALRISLHPEGLAPRIVNLAEWREHVHERLRRQIAASPDPALVALERELRGYGEPVRRIGVDEAGRIAVPLRLRDGDHELAFITTTAMFGTPADITVSELMVESFFPADEATAERLRVRARV